MKRFVGFISILLATLVISLPAHAQTPEAPRPAAQVTAEHKIEVRGRVLPNRYITIDPDGVILRIDSNTTEDVAPRVFVNSIRIGNEVPLTDDVYVFYRYIIPEGQAAIGTLYENTAATLFGPQSLSTKLPLPLKVEN